MILCKRNSSLREFNALRMDERIWRTRMIEYLNLPARGEELDETSGLSPEALERWNLTRLPLALLRDSRQYTNVINLYLRDITIGASEDFYVSTDNVIFVPINRIGNSLHYKGNFFWHEGDVEYVPLFDGENPDKLYLSVKSPAKMAKILTLPVEKRFPCYVPDRGVVVMSSQILANLALEVLPNLKGAFVDVGNGLVAGRMAEGLSVYVTPTLVAEERDSLNAVAEHKQNFGSIVDRFFIRDPNGTFRPFTIDDLRFPL